MNVNEILDLNTIKVNLDARDKEEALNELVDVLLTEEYITNKEQFLSDIYAREAEGQTGIGNYIAIPHGKSSAASKVGVAIGLLKEEIEWETLDDNGVKVIILFCVGDDTDGATNHLRLLSMFARKLGNDDVVESVLKAKSANDIIVSFGIE